MLREIIVIVPNVARSLRVLLFALSATALGCHAQGSPQPGVAVGALIPGGQLSPDLARRIEIMIRSRSDLPAEYQVTVGDRTKSEIPGFDLVRVVISANGKTSVLPFLLSTDGKTLAQFNRFDISEDPKLKVSDAGRPARGGPATAPVLIVGFDDLECPYCSKMHAQLFPAILDRYKDRVRIVYRDFPLDQIHPWAMRAAIDANCLAASPAGYWNFVDYVHLHASELGGEDKSLAKANDALDKLAQDEGARQHLSETDVAACVKKQDDTQVRASMKVGDALGVDATPALFINGEKLEGAEPIDVVYRMIDQALTAVGQTPPPMTPPPAPAAAVAVPPKTVN